MKLPNDLELKPELINYNPQAQTLYKLAANSLFGKLQQKNNYSKKIYVSSQSELEDCFFSNEKQIENILCFDNLCQINVKCEEKDVSTNRETNCYLGAQVVCYGRQIIYQHLITLLNSSAKVFYIDTDSLFFSLPNHIENPLPISDALGHFKDVYTKNIENFISFGPKNYVISFESSSNSIKEIVKVSGLSLQSHINDKKVDFKLYDEYLTFFLKDTPKKKIRYNLNKSYCKL